MDKNNKLDKLLQTARNTKPVVSFEEASSLVKGASVNTGIFSSSMAKGMIAFVSAGVISIAGYYFFANPAAENTITIAPTEQPVENKTVELPRATEALQTTTDAPVTEQMAAIEKKESGEKVDVKSDGENVGIKFTEIKSNTLRTVTITNATGIFTLKFGGDDLKEMLLNNETVSDDKWNSYPDVVAQALETISNNKKSDNGSDVNDKNFMNDLKNKLIKDGLITGDVSSLQFNKDGLLINGNALDAATHKHYLDFYKQKTGKEIGATNFSIKGNRN